jgi:hypothetical protein
VKPGPDLEPYIQDALDEIEYVSGPASSTWGSLRAKAGHPAPFKLTYVEVGNEDFFDKSGSYDQRFVQFKAAIKARYPTAAGHLDGRFRASRKPARPQRHAGRGRRTLLPDGRGVPESARAV